MSNRTKLIVDFESQGVVVRKAIFHWIIFTVSALVITGIIQFCSAPFIGLQANLIATLKVFAPVLLTLLCLGPVFVYDFLKLSNRIFGPIPRIRDKIHDLSEGEHVTELRARKNDIHASMVEDVNTLIKMVNESRGNSGQNAAPVNTAPAAPAPVTTTPNNTENTQPVETKPVRTASDDQLLEEVNMLRAVVKKLTETPTRQSVSKETSASSDVEE